MGGESTELVFGCEDKLFWVWVVASLFAQGRIM
jgi:hypothetical protein